ncbi:ATP-binding protein [Roseibium litorale]|uniref:histidine kinase n=1 Tax=Roseibium litorale TaxID=2803841 RepID=A0ABR9CS00_9HYPH|nr:ATP-binding protein [Roseibium litorale]MBD8893615.1 sensor histidine kinase N-terminal domain-containing protein [Roseibium litorale]
MRLPRTLQVRLTLGIGLLSTLLWIGAAAVTAVQVQKEMNEVFDAALMEVAQRLLPLAVIDIVGRDDDGVTQRLAAIRAHEERLTYIIRDAEGHVLVQSHAADPALFPAYDGPGFRQTATLRLYNEDALQGSIRLTVAEPLSRREKAAREAQIGLGLPLLAVIPITLLAVGFVLRGSLAPLRQFRDALATRGARDMSPVDADALPGEITPITDTLNGLLSRLKAAFDAERSFAANAAHELRTPLAGAIAQAQRLQSETSDPDAARRAGEIEASLKRLTRVSERLMQMARAEGGRLRTDTPRDVRPVLRIIMEDLERLFPVEHIHLSMPEQPVLSDIDPDALGILIRNLVENAFRYAAPKTAIKVELSPHGQFSVENECPAISADVLQGLTNRFERPTPSSKGAGLGLAIVATIADRTGGELVLKSPVPGKSSGFLAEVSLPAGE